MACDLTAGRLVACKDQIGGIKAAYVIDTYCDNIRDQATIANDVMTTAGFASWSTYGNTTSMKVTFFKYDLRPELSGIEITENSDPATGTTFYEQTVTLTLQTRTAASSYQLRLMALNRPQVVIEDNNGNIYLLGMDHGMNKTQTSSTGTGFGDMPGYTVTLTGREKEEVIWIGGTADPTSAVHPFAGLVDNTAVEVTAGVEPV